ncbi:MAG: DUF3604 domain-containing protein [Deltaproteobacteria bacterium]|nr:MAG: DUF3604 domain-containing protein [Deltaproteobacteria bacterium]
MRQKIEAQDGTNPYEFGMIGSIDPHTAMAFAGENNLHGKMAQDSTTETGTSGISQKNDSGMSFTRRFTVVLYSGASRRMKFATGK